MKIRVVLLLLALSPNSFVFSPYKCWQTIRGLFFSFFRGKMMFKMFQQVAWPSLRYRLFRLFVLAN
jgi:hypothetical protein